MPVVGAFLESVQDLDCSSQKNKACLALQTNHSQTFERTTSTSVILLSAGLSFSTSDLKIFQIQGDHPEKF